MASPSTPNLVSAEVRFTWAEQQVENRLHFQYIGGVFNQTHMETLANTIDANVLNLWLPLLTANVTLREIYVEAYQGPASFAFTLATGGVGTATGDSMAPQNSFCLSLRSGLSGRSNRGRFYTIGMSENAQVSGVVSTTYRDGWLAALDDLRITALAEDWQLVVASFVSGGLPRPTGETSVVTAIIAVDDFVDSQRRRGRGRGA